MKLGNLLSTRGNHVRFQFVRALIAYIVISLPFKAPSVHRNVAEVLTIFTTCTPPGGPGGPCTIRLVLLDISPTALFKIHPYSPDSANVAFIMSRYSPSMCHRGLFCKSLSRIRIPLCVQIYATSNISSVWPKQRNV